MSAKNLRMLGVRNRQQWRNWMRAHHDSKSEIWLVFNKRHRCISQTRQKPSQDSHERSYAFTAIRATSRTSKNYSYLSAIIGSTRIARRAGM
jgi:hypothetical protein